MPEPISPPQSDGGSGARGPQSGGPDPGQLAVTGLWVALAPILMLFLAFVSAYVVRHVAGRNWVAVPIPAVVWLNTGVLLLSSWTLEIGRRGTTRGEATSTRWLRLTFGLGVLFLIGQVVAWSLLVSRGIAAGTTPHGSFFYLLTGTHALHLVAGLIALAFAARWPESGYRRISRRVAVRLAATYWHFMTIVWLGLFLLLVLVK